MVCKRERYKDHTTLFSFPKTDKGGHTVLPIPLKLPCSGFLPFVKTVQSASGPQLPLDKHSQADSHSELPSLAAHYPQILDFLQGGANV